MEVDAWEGLVEQEWPTSGPTSLEWQAYVRQAWRGEAVVVAVADSFDPAGWGEDAGEDVQASRDWWCLAAGDG